MPTSRTGEGSGRRRDESRRGTQECVRHENRHGSRGFSGLVLQASFYPLGYPVEIVSSEAAVLETASELWATWPRLFDAPPVRIEVNVHRGSPPLSRPGFTLLPGLLRFCSDEMNFAEFDEASRCGSIRIANEALGSPLFRHYFLETLALTALDAIFFTPLHAACISRAEVGTLLCGDSGAGKSSLAYACARRGWTLVSDDAVHLAPGSARIGVGASRVIRLREPGADPTAEQTIEIDAAGQGLRTAPSAALGQCIFLRRRPGPAAWREMHPNAALNYFLKYLVPRYTARARTHLHEFLDSPVRALEYEHIEEAAAMLEAL